MRYYLTSKATPLVYVTMIIPLSTSSYTLKALYNNTKALYNNTQKLTCNSLDRGKLNFPSIKNFANHERVLLVKSCLCKESDENFNNYFKLFEHKYKTRNNAKGIKIPAVKLEFAKQGFFFSKKVYAIVYQSK